MLKSDDLKVWLHKDLSRHDKALLILATFSGAAQLADLRERAKDAGFRIPPKWNMSQVLGASRGKAVRAPEGWELTNAGQVHLKELGVAKISPAALQTATDLRDHLSKVSDPETYDFVEEAIKCHEAELYRSAIVMSWLGAMDVLHKHIHNKHLAAFNTEAKRVNGKWKPAKTPDDLGKMGEAEFLDRVAAISVLGKNTKEELQKALGLRNGCGHPNSLKVSANKSAAHIETLLQNVFQKFG